MTVFSDVPTIVPSQHARRDILVAAWEEDAVLDLLRFMSAQHGETDRHWLEAIGREATRGILSAYRYGSGRVGFEAVDATRLVPESIGGYGDGAIYLSRTDKTLLEIRSLPLPSAESFQRVIGLWGTRHEQCDE